MFKHDCKQRLSSPSPSPLPVVSPQSKNSELMLADLWVVRPRYKPLGYIQYLFVVRLTHLHALVTGTSGHASPIEVKGHIVNKILVLGVQTLGHKHFC
ncbi:hypothetical protein E2C01_021284 [Portunus trituberculatus]|uniref:Uncharacterized protein n=1 Tax=Portunus trituberculatus TaxID=210409 RepID=A0A5B7E2U8_PORTR|nr:hypothetical protein [Portunus trituberculatus]